MSETSAGETDGQPAMSEEQLAEIREHNGQYGLGDATDIIEELLAEVERLNAVLDANRVVRNAAESSSRTYKGAMELLKAQRTQLRAELADERKRAEVAERELAAVNVELEGACKDADYFVDKRHNYEDTIKGIQAELADMRGQLTAIGETQEEWGVRRTWTTDGETRTGYAICENEDHAHAALEHYSALDRFERNAVECALVKRLAGEWREVGGGE